MVVVVGGGLAELFVVAVTVAVSVALRLRLRCGRGAGVGAVASDDLGTLRVRALGYHTKGSHHLYGYMALSGCVCFEQVFACIC